MHNECVNTVDFIQKVIVDWELKWFHNWMWFETGSNISSKSNMQIIIESPEKHIKGAFFSQKNSKKVRTQALYAFYWCQNNGPEQWSRQWSPCFDDE